jgi:hypothetical protein
MQVRSSRVLATLALWALACGSEPAQVEEPVEVAPIAGMYEVHGDTVALETGHKREIAGTVILADEGASYTATFNLTTTYPGAEEALPAEVIGKGEGSIEGRTLRGTAQTQLVMATVPGVDPGFAFVPRMVSTRIENQPAEGEESYVPTRTTLRGSRISAAGIGGDDDAP